MKNIWPAIVILTAMLMLFFLAYAFYSKLPTSTAPKAANAIEKPAPPSPAATESVQ
jgi:hypothetical protein